MNKKSSTTRNTQERQERRIRWQHGLSKPQAALVARLGYGEVAR